MQEPKSIKIKWTAIVRSTGKAGVPWVRVYHGKELSTAPFDSVFKRNLLETGRATLVGRESRYEAELLEQHL